MFLEKIKIEVEPNISAKNAMATDYDTIIFVKGSETSVYFNKPQVLSLAIEANKHSNPI